MSDYKRLCQTRKDKKENDIAVCTMPAFILCKYGARFISFLKEGWSDFLEKKMRASFTIEATILLGMYLLIVGGVISLSITLYEDIRQTAGYQIVDSRLTNAQVVRMKVIKGELYEQYTSQYNIQEKTK